MEHTPLIKRSGEGYDKKKNRGIKRKNRKRLTAGNRGWRRASHIIEIEKTERINHWLRMRVSSLFEERPLAFY